MKTELRIEGADCPMCFNRALDVLRATPGIGDVVASRVGGCVAIEHTGIDPAELVTILRTHLHGVEMAGGEIVMVSVDPLVANLHCDHVPG